MKTSASELMKELKSIKRKLQAIREADLRDSKLNMVQEDDGVYRPQFAIAYDYRTNRDTVASLRERELAIKTLLNVHNINTKVDGFDYTIAEALVRMAQVKEDITLLSNLAHRTQRESTSSLRFSSYTELAYSVEEAKEDLSKAYSELSALQVAVDRANLTRDIDVGKKEGK